MNKRQRESIVKLLYDIVRLSFTGLIIGGVITDKGIGIFPLILGLVLAILSFTTAYFLERKED